MIREEDTLSTLEVRHEHGDRFTIRVRGHEVVVDQPLDAGGSDTGPTPTEMFVGGLAACVGFFAVRYLRRHDLPTAGLAVSCAFTMTRDRPARVTDIAVRVAIPPDLPAARRIALQRVVEHCTVHESITNEPTITIELEDASAPERRTA